MSNRTAILILGMHRSGSSALARSVHLQGAALPKTLMPSQSDNLEGFWESLPIVRLNNQLLSEAERAWDDPRPIETTWWLMRGERRHRVEQAAKLLVSEYPDAELVALKDPRLSRLMPIWLEASAQSGFTPLPMLCCRNPLEVADSLAQRNGIDLRHAQLLWLAYMLDAERATRGHPRAWVHYDQLLVDWRGTLARAYGSLGLDALTLSGEVATALDEWLQPDKRNHRHDTDQVLRDQRLSTLTKDTWAALLTEPKPSDKVFDALNERLADAWSTFGHSSSNVSSAAIQLSQPGNNMSVHKAHPSNAQSSNLKQRHIILHYHLFKNAGTSLDQILKQNFKDGWHEHEGPGPGWRSEDVTEYLRQHPEILVLSSHTALLPAAVLPDTTVYPIIFIRHPIDRIRSVYEFERKQIADTEGSRVAKEVDMAGYIKWRLSRKGDRSIRNFQAYRLAFAVPEILDGVKLSEEERAMKALKTLPFVGVVEQFDESLARLDEWLKPVFPDIEVKPTKVNVTQREDLSLKERLQALNNDIGEVMYGQLLSANDLDINLYQRGQGV
ncbi:sulfotransferase family 2 domain-containing protein [Thiorhodococcus mannitoliphagus]|uniref:Sulfotransferase family 2 domain-containing protein n=1 Tax=Thiorhodococcus mannitoliphagus TaxID=329406 RepID=A0A6P1DY43_9GAMM|nr:sulfotransferase family 2 domain-containing protein [Thiorhodococcus mannitoliphagus]NEX23237.1 sulfotransferase family 2 domain-containing protein [Thiorhodococcus mannitoliphagus]